MVEPRAYGVIGRLYKLEMVTVEESFFVAACAEIAPMRVEVSARQPFMTDSDLSRLRWRCRRGMRELDLLLTRWLDREYVYADASQRAVFVKLLACEDDRLWRWFIGRETPDEKDLDELVGHILALSP